MMFCVKWLYHFTSWANCCQVAFDDRVENQLCRGGDNKTPPDQNQTVFLFLEGGSFWLASLKVCPRAYNYCFCADGII